MAVDVYTQEKKNKLGMFYLTLTYHSYQEFFIQTKAAPISYSDLKCFIKETRIWTLKYPFKLQKKLREINKNLKILKKQRATYIH